MTLILREDLDPWNCQKCEAKVYGGQILNGRFYCHSCAPGIEKAFRDLVEDYTLVTARYKRQEVKSEEA